MVWDIEALDRLISQALQLNPSLKKEFKRDPHQLYKVVSRIWVLNEIQKEFSFEAEEMEGLIKSLFYDDMRSIQDQARLENFYEQVCESSSEISQESSFRQGVKDSLKMRAQKRAQEKESQET